MDNSLTISHLCEIFTGAHKAFTAITWDPVTNMSRTGYLLQYAMNREPGMNRYYR